MALVWLGGAWVISVAAILGHHIAVDSSGELASLDNPVGGTAWWGHVQNVFFPLLAFTMLASVGRQLISFAKSGDERRQQLKWRWSGPPSPSSAA